MSDPELRIKPDQAKRKMLWKRLSTPLKTACSCAIFVLAIAGCGGDAKLKPGQFASADAAQPAPGGRLVVSLRSEPQTLNPVLALDRPSTEVIRRMTADLIHINRHSQATEGALGESWTVSDNGQRFVLKLRQGVKFSDGDPFDADDVVFSFQVFQDEEVGSPNRDLLVIDGEPIKVHKVDSHTVEFELSRPHAVGDRIFDSVPMLPSHLLEEQYRQGSLSETWRLDTRPAQIAGLGPFRFKSYMPAQRLVLERNPHYWKTDVNGTPLPYLDELVFVFTPSQDARVLRFQGGDIDVIDDLKAGNFSILEAGAQDRGYRLTDLGAGLEFNFLFFNLNEASPGQAKLAAKQKWFRNKSFRQAVSAAVDRVGIARLVYQGRATPIWSHVSPGNRAWFHAELPRPARSLERARELLLSAGFGWKDEVLIDANGVPVALTLVTNSSNSERVQIMTIVQEDLRQLGMDVQVVPLEFRALLDRILETKDYDVCVLGLGGGDVDPNPLMNVLLSSGGSHLWNPGQSEPATAWEAEIDRLMTEQATVLDHDERKAIYDRVQELMADELPLVPLVSPNILVGAKSNLGNFKPAILDHHTLWNVEELFWAVN